MCRIWACVVFLNIYFRLFFLILFFFNWGLLLLHRAIRPSSWTLQPLFSSLSVISTCVALLVILDNWFYFFVFYLLPIILLLFINDILYFIRWLIICLLSRFSHIIWLINVLEFIIIILILFLHDILHLYILFHFRFNHFNLINYLLFLLLIYINSIYDGPIYLLATLGWWFNVISF
jgi:hypothetical protein